MPSACRSDPEARPGSRESALRGYSSNCDQEFELPRSKPPDLGSAASPKFEVVAIASRPAPPSARAGGQSRVRSGRRATSASGRPRNIRRSNVGNLRALERGQRRSGSTSDTPSVAVPRGAAVHPAWCARRSRLSPGRSESSPAPRRPSLDPRLVGDPVHLPALSAIVGEGLLEVRRGLRDLRPDVAHEDRPALPRLLVVELAAPVAELSHRGNSKRRALLRRPVE